MKIKKKMQLLGLLNPAETPELKSAVTAIGNANTEAEIADILNGFTVKFIKTLANYEAIWNINGLKKSELVAKISRVIAARFNAINHRNIFRDYSPIDKVYLMRTQGITPDYIWDRNNWDKDNSDKSNPKYSACTYKLPNDDSQHELPATADDAISANDNDTALASQPAAVANAEISQPDALYMDDSFSDAPGDNSECARNQDFPVDILECTPAEIAQPEKYAFITGNVYISSDNRPFTVINRSENFIILADEHGKTLTRKIYTSSYCEAVRLEKFTVGSLFLSAISLKKNNTHDDNPGFTIVPSEHIERPQYTTYPDTIIDECPYVTVPACDIPENHSHAAVVPYNQASGIRCFLQLIAIYIRLWLASNITPDNDAIRSFVFAPWLVELEKFAPGNPNDFSPLIYKWRRKDFSEKLKLCRSQIATCKTREEIIAALQGISSESIRLLCVADRVFDKFTRIAAPECERKLAYARRYADKIIQRREKAMTIKAEVKDITAQQPHVKLKKKYTVNPSPRIEVRPEAAPADIEHKLIETKDLHFSDKRKALDHNAAVISSCMFSEAVISLLSSISLQAILQLGFHMRLFIAKPKGKKNVVAELFAQRLIARRDIRANVRSKSGNTAANNTANVPDGVKFFVGARRQICFKFED